jgi:hypothetical protein
MLTVYSQNICAEGHYFVGSNKRRTFDVPTTTDDSNVCPICGKAVIWSNWVNNTLIDHFGYIPPELLEITPTTKTRTCVKKSEGVYEETIHTIVGTYRVPDESKLKELRGYVFFADAAIHNCFNDKVLSVNIPT